MSRTGAQRALSLPEELERLEQQITLTLQEIDSNFSRAHRIVTSSILPIVEQYAKHSNDVWEGSKFWKQFFEASANVSLSGYEERAADEDTLRNEDTSTSLHTPTDHDEESVEGAQLEEADDIDFSVDSPTQVTGTQSTPKLATANTEKRTATTTSNFRSPSPRKYTGRSPFGASRSSEGPSTPRPQTRKPDASSPFQPQSAFLPSAGQPERRTNNDPLMHRVLDKNYRIQATPHTQRKQPQKSTKATPATATKTRPWDDSPGSSPVVAAPQLRSELFSPIKKGGERTPGISIMTPPRYNPTAATTTSTGRQLFSPQDKGYTNTRRSANMFSDTEDTDFLDGMSPPKTMQFHVPQSRLMQTPAKEASRRIVEDLLLTAGAEDTDEIEGQDLDDFEIDFGEDEDEQEMDEGSPSIIRARVEEDTF